MSDYEKLEYAFELLLSASEYAFDGEGNPIENESTLTLIGALIDGSAVCEGYAMAFNFLCDALGISSFVIVSEELDHAWNIVELDGAWYFVDATWSDTSSDTYFLLGSTAFEESHGTFDELLDYPELSEDYYGKPVEMFYVTFMVNGEEYASVPVESGSLVTVPEAPQIEGYTFDGWITLS